MLRQVSCDTIYDQLGLQDAPLVIDIRGAADVKHVPRMIPGSLLFDANEIPHWSRRIPSHRSIALCSAHGEVDQSITGTLTTRGLRVSVMEGGLDEWAKRDLPTIKMRDDLGVPGRSQWITRERPKIDRLACPWLVRRFIDPTAMFFYVPAQNVRAEAATLGAEPYDIADVTFTHRGSRCSFDAFMDEFELRDPILDEVATIVRAADTGMLEHSREAPGLLAISLGLSATISDDLMLLEQAMPLYDALYAWRKTARDETHSWPQKAAQR